MKVLYHGTRYIRSILADQCLRVAPYVDETLSLTTRKHVAKYFAELWRDDVFDFGYIITLDWMLLQKDGYGLRPFNCPSARFNEHEWVCTRPIKAIWRYILKIERVPDSYVGPEELARRKAQIMNTHIDKHGSMPVAPSALEKDVFYHRPIP